MIDTVHTMFILCMQEDTALYHAAANRTCITVINIHSESLRSPKCKNNLSLYVHMYVWELPYGKYLLYTVLLDVRLYTMSRLLMSMYVCLQ